MKIHADEGGLVTGPRVSFKQPLFGADELQKRWSDRHMLVRSRDELATFYRQVEADPRLADLDVDESVATEMLEFYNSVVVDGRFIYHLREEPNRAAEAIGLQPSDRALELVSRAARMTGPQGGNDVTIAVAVVIVIVCAVPDQQAEIVVDWTQQVELKL
jgi:hypothetical protein